jgi:hypothetical protein
MRRSDSLDTHESYLVNYFNITGVAAFGTDKSAVVCVRTAGGKQRTEKLRMPVRGVANSHTYTLVYAIYVYSKNVETSSRS